MTQLTAGQAAVLAPSHKKHGLCIPTTLPATPCHLPCRLQPSPQQNEHTTPNDHSKTNNNSPPAPLILSPLPHLCLALARLPDLVVLCLVKLEPAAAVAAAMTLNQALLALGVEGISKLLLGMSEQGRKCDKIDRTTGG